MASSRERRLAKELADIHADKDNSGVYAQSIDGSSLTHLKGTFQAPPDSPYVGGTYKVDIQIPTTYPFKSPIIKFETKIWHPNISSQTGAICLDTLGSGWSPVQTIKTALISLRTLLDSPNPNDPQDAEVAHMLQADPEAYAQKAHDWAVKYAGARPEDAEAAVSKWRKAPSNTKATSRADEAARYGGYNRDMINRFVSMGFSVDAVVEAFRYVGIPRGDGQDLELEEAYMGDITARLLGEP
ncbi:Fc.00g075280.m01.CDS01 [Cosmosporella sp. VM-42]